MSTRAINTTIGSETIGSHLVGGGGEATAHPFDVSFEIHTDKFQHISARFLKDAMNNQDAKAQGGRRTIRASSLTW
jgi:hypothetical protein